VSESVPLALPVGGLMFQVVVGKNDGMAHRKRGRHFHEVGHLHELTFSCSRRLPLLTNDVWREKLARCVEAADEEWAMELVGFVFMPEHVHLLVYPTALARRSRNQTPPTAVGGRLRCAQIA